MASYSRNGIVREYRRAGAARLFASADVFAAVIDDGSANNLSYIRPRGAYYEHLNRAAYKGDGRGGLCRLPQDVQRRRLADQL